VGARARLRWGEVNTNSDGGWGWKRGGFGPPHPVSVFQLFSRLARQFSDQVGTGEMGGQGEGGGGGGEVGADRGRGRRRCLCRERKIGPGKGKAADRRGGNAEARGRKKEGDQPKPTGGRGARPLLTEGICCLVSLI